MAGAYQTRSTFGDYIAQIRWTKVAFHPHVLNIFW